MLEVSYRGKSSTSISTSPTNYPVFDYLRFFAAVGVFMSHSDQAGILPLEFGNACVQIFFALSGFLIGGILLRSAPKDIPRFFFNRTTRIWIPYFIAIALVLCAVFLKQDIHDRKLWEFFGYDATFTYNFFGPPQLASFVDRMPLQGTANHFWSICVEEQFYLVAPFVILFFRKGLVPILLAVIALNFFLPNDFAAVALGVLLAVVSRGHWLESNRARLSFFALAMAGLFSIYLGAVSYHFAFPLVAAAIVAMLALPGTRNDVGTVLGGLSFSFYLNAWVSAFMVNFIIKKLHIEAPHYVIVLADLSSAILMSLAHYYFVDSTIHAKRGKMFSREIGVACLIAAIALMFSGIAMGFYFKSFPLT